MSDLNLCLVLIVMQTAYFVIMNHLLKKEIFKMWEILLDLIEGFDCADDFCNFEIKKKQ